MASLTLASVADLFPVGTVVSAYPASGWQPTSLPPSGAPVPSATTSATVASSGSLAFTGLADDTRYFAGAQVSGVWRYRGFRTAPAVVSTGGGSGVSSWATGTAYTLGQVVVNSGKLYQAVDAHTAGATFGGDSAHWTQLDAEADATALAQLATHAADNTAHGLTAALAAKADATATATALAAKADASATTTALAAKADTTALAAKADAGLAPSNFRKWRKAVANVRTGVSGAKVLVVGDSTSWGKNAAGTNPPAQQSWPARLSGLLNSYFVPSSLGLQSYSNPDPADTRWTLGTGWTVSSNNTAGFAGYCLNGASGAAGALTFAPGYSVDTIDVYWVRNTGFGSSIVTVDGGGTLATIAATGTAGIQKTTVSLGSLASNHVVSLAGPTGGQFFLIGIDAYDSTTPRVRVSLTGVSASVTGIAGQSGAKWLNSSAAYNSNGCITAYAPDLTIMMLGVNDASPGSAGVATYTAAGWATATQSLITLAQASGDVLLVSVVPSSSAGLTSTTAGVALEVAFAAQAKSLAAANNCGFVDLNARWVDYATANADGLMADTLHPLRLGHADIAQLIFKSLVAI